MSNGLYGIQNNGGYYVVVVSQKLREEYEKLYARNPINHEIISFRSIEEAEKYAFNKYCSTTIFSVKQKVNVEWEDGI